jgi:hypothetical protein
VPSPPDSDSPEGNQSAVVGGNATATSLGSLARVALGQIAEQGSSSALADAGFVDQFTGRSFACSHFGFAGFLNIKSQVLDACRANEVNTYFRKVLLVYAIFRLGCQSARLWPAL